MSLDRDAATTTPIGGCRALIRRFVLPLILITSGALLIPSAGATLWTSDDYSLVYGIDGRDVPSLSQSLGFGGAGRLSAHRLLCYPWIGYFGGAVGPSLSHLAQIALHLLVGYLIWRQLRTLHFPVETACWGIAFFLLSPWIGQPLCWWSSSVTLIHTAMILLSVLCFTHALRSRHYWRWVAVASMFVFLALTFYELWLCSGILFVFIAWYEIRLNEGGSLFRANQLKSAILKSLPMAVPYGLWGIWFVMSHTAPDAVHRPQFTALRIPVVALSVHVRFLQSIFELPWIESIGNGIRHGVAPVVLLIAGGVFLDAISRTDRADAGSAGKSTESVRRQLGERLLLAWGFFLSSRFVFIMQGGVSLHSRHNYGAAIALAIAFASLGACLSSRYDRRGIGIAQLLIVAAMGLALSGIAWNYATTSRQEELAFQQIRDDVSESPRKIRWVVITGGEVPEWGEMPFYFELAGEWLQFRLRQVEPDLNVAVVSQFDQLAESLQQRELAPNSSELAEIAPETILLYRRLHDGNLQRLESEIPLD